MHKIKRNLASLTLLATSLIYTGSVLAQPVDNNVQVDQNELHFQIPNFRDILTFLIRFFFVVAGIAALIFLLWGALSWVTSGGDKGNVEKARDKIVAAIVGVLLVVVVVAIVATLEQVVFKNTLCFGLTCPVTLPNLLRPR